MYYQVVSQLSVHLHALDAWLDKAERLAVDKKFDIDVLLNGRLAPDMGNFIYQVQSSCDYIKGGAAWLSGQQPPRHEDNERTLDDLRQRIRKTIDFIASVDPSQYADAAVERVRVSWSPAGKIILGEGYLLQVVVPNAYFHLVTAYAILRHNGVDVGKMDFLGPINWVAEVTAS